MNKFEDVRSTGQKEENTMGKYEQDARLLLAYVGGKENIAAVSHCVSRMRFALRKKMPVISAGKIEFLYPDNADLLAYRRYDGETELLVLCNLREREIAKPLPVGWTDAEKLLGNYPDTADTLRPYECVVLKK